MKKLVLKNLIQVGVVIVFLLAVWWIAYHSVGNDLLIPPPSDSVQEIGALLTKALFWQALGGTLLRALFAFVISFLLAVFFAVVAYLLPWFERFFAPIVSVLRSMPILAVLLILLSFLDAGQAPIAVAFLSLFPMLYTGVLAALSGIDKHLIEVSRVYGASRFGRIWRVYLPLSSPYVLREAGGALSFALKLVVSAEVVAVTARSLGGMMQEARVYAEIPQLFALVMLVFIVGLILELAVTALAVKMEKRCA